MSSVIKAGQENQREYRDSEKTRLGSQGIYYDAPSAVYCSVAQ